MEKLEISKFLKESVNWLVKSDCGCCAYKLPNGLAIVVGWSDGYDRNDDTVVHSVSEPSFAINAAVKLSVSSMKTDMDIDYNFLYFENGEIIDTSYSIAPNEDYENLADYLLNEYNELKDYEFDDHGLINDPIDYDRQAIENHYGLEYGELDEMSIREAEEYLCIEEGELDIYLLEK